MAAERTFPVIPDVSRSVQSAFRDLQRMAYDGQDQIQNLNSLLPANTFSGEVTLAKLTGGGQNGSITFENGWATKVVQPT